MRVRSATALVLSALVCSALPARAQDASAAAPPLSLEGAVARSLGATPTLRIADLEVDAASARARASRAALLPTLSGSASWMNQTENLESFGFDLSAFGGAPLPTEIGPFSVFDARARVTQTLFDWASVRRLEAANAGTAVSRAARDVRGQEAASRAAMAYLAAARARATVAAREEDVRLASELASLAQTQLEAGVSTGLDVTRAKTELAGAQGQLLVAQNDEQQSEIALVRALGLDPSRRFTLTDTLSASLGASAAPTTDRAAIEMALARRPELHVERERMHRADLERSALGAERLPSLKAEADWGANGPPSADIIATRRVAVELSVPIFDGFRREGRIAEQDAAAREAHIRENDLERQIAADVQSATLALESATRREAVALDRLTFAQEELAQARERYQQGIAGNIDVINAQATLVHARDAVIDARFAAAAARVELARATGVAETVH